jgi:hypothetical protein
MKVPRTQDSGSGCRAQVKAFYAADDSNDGSIQQEEVSSRASYGQRGARARRRGVPTVASCG